MLVSVAVARVGRSADLFEELPRLRCLPQFIALYVAFFSAISSFAAVRDATYSHRPTWLSINSIRAFTDTVVTLRDNPYFWALSLISLADLFGRAKPANEVSSSGFFRLWVTLFALVLAQTTVALFFVLLIPTAWVLVAAWFDLT